ncbi:MAG TPA: peptide chain release factor 1 [Candidatus Babeliales bacterium]|nr:peptide chain release factor 1 [Candidatus Babeliales bacterium]
MNMTDLAILQKKYDDLASELAAITDNAKRVVLQKELARLLRIIDAQKDLERCDALIADAKNQLKQSSNDPEMIELFKLELHDLGLKKLEKERALEDVMIPSDEHDDRSVFIEIRAGAGGQEAALFAADLLRMYTNYALKKGWRATVVDESFTDLGGIRDVTLHVQGEGAYGCLKFEAGVHRVQRVPKTETAGRVHTSTATVAVLPEAEEVDVSINPADLRIDVFRASGAGGQHVNTTDSAVRITHIPTGVVVSCQDERSQHKNKAKALKVLQSRLLAFEKERHAAEVGKQRKEMVGRGMRAEKARTYNFPQNRVTDHNADITLKKLDYVMEGDLDEIIEALRTLDREERRKLALQQ